MPPVIPPAPEPYPPYQNPNRVSQTTAADAASNARLQSIAPAQGGWSPAQWVPLVVALAVGVLGSIGALLASGGVLTLPLVLGAIVTGISTALAGFFGVKSAGPRKPDVPPAGG